MEPLTAADPVRVGPHTLRARLGAGAMGRVYLARSPDGRLVAVKVVKAEFAEDPGFRRRFRMEVQAARRVGGLYTALVLDADPDAPIPWLATVYVPGPSLDAAVRAHGPLPPDAVVALAAALAEALVAVHDKKLVHRDLKPSNILLAADGPRVIDFGIVHAVDATRRTVGMIGTPAYMSPEQVREGEVGPASDVFSLGGVLHFAATGEPPFAGGNLHAILHQVVSAEPDLARLPDDLRALVGRCLAKDPADRPAPAVLLDELATAPAADLITGPHATMIDEYAAATLRYTRAAPPGERPPPKPPGEDAPGGPRREWRPGSLLPRPTKIALAAALALFLLLTGVYTVFGGEAEAPSAGERNTDAAGGPFRPWAADGGHGPPIVSGGLAHVSNENGVTAHDALTGEWRWRFPARPGRWPPRLPGSGETHSYEIVLLGGRLVAYDERRILSLDPATGTRQWTHPLEAEPDGVVLLAGRLLVYDERRVLSLDPATGTRRWTFALEGAPVAQAPCVADRTAGGLIVVMNSTTRSGAADSGRRRVQALDPATGVARWRLDLDGGRSCPLVRADRIHLDTDDALIWYDTRTWQRRRLPYGQKRYLSELEADGDTAYALVTDPGADYAERLYALDAATGRRHWDHLIPEGAAFGPERTGSLLRLWVWDRGLLTLGTADGRPRWAARAPADPDLAHDRPTVSAGIAYFDTVDDGVAAVDLTTGRKLWTRDRDRAAEIQGTHGHAVYVKSVWERALRPDVHRLTAYDVRTGRRLWRLDLEAEYVVPAGKAVYVVDDRYRLLAIDAATGKAPA